MKVDTLLNSALEGLDTIGYRLESWGITDRVNRHTVIAYALAEQHHMEGELDSVRARVDHYQWQLENRVNQVERLARAGIDLALKPARLTLGAIRGRTGS